MNALVALFGFLLIQFCSAEYPHCNTIYDPFIPCPERYQNGTFIDGNRPNPNEICSNLFFKCSDGVSYCFNCQIFEDGSMLYYDHSKLECDYRVNVAACTGAPPTSSTSFTTTSTSTTTIPSTTTSFTSTTTRPSTTTGFKCPQPNGLFPINDGICSQDYYSCSSGSPYVLSCPSGSLFDPALLICIDAAVASCNFQCSLKDGSYPVPGYSSEQHFPGEMAGFLLGNDILRKPTLIRAIASINRWPNGQVPYTIASDFSTNQKAVIEKVMQEYHSYTCIRFIPRTTQVDYISIVNIGGCTSYIGKIGGAQEVTLGSGCADYSGVVEHELMHAVGFEHMQQRYDRDSYIYVNMANVIQGNDYAFSKESPIGRQLLGTPYDTQSVMHYSNFAQIDPTIPVMVAYDGSRIGSKDIFTKTDLLSLNRLYNCDANDCWNFTNCNGGQGPLIWQSGNYGQFVYANGCDFSGNDIASISTTTHEVCRRHCLINPSCSHITWNPISQMCYMKQSTNPYPLSIRAVPYLGAVCGYVNIRSPPCL